MEVQGKEFECVDPRGIRIVCFVRAWEHATKHREIEGEEGIIKAIIETPDFINRSKVVKNSHLYYKRLVLKTVGDTYVRVVTEIKREHLLNKWGLLKTALACNGEREEEVRLWTK